MTQSASEGGSSRNLDLLRAVAVLCVFFAHLTICLIEIGYFKVASPAAWKTNLTELGHVGVLFFFVHTALVLMHSLHRSDARTSAPIGKARLLLNFYIRRTFRIYPLSIVCIVAVLLLQIPQVPYGKYVSWSWAEIASNLLLIQNITRVPDMIMPLWTLPREFQMYLALPFIYLFLKRFSAGIVVLLLWVAFFAAVPWAPLLSCFPCFLGGVFAYQLAKERVFRLPSKVWPLAIATLYAGHAWSMTTIWADYRSDFILCMFLGALIPNFLDLGDSWLTRSCQTIAKYSYGIYLCHDPVLWWSFVKLKAFPVPAQWAALILAMVLIPLILHLLLEAPAIQMGRRLATMAASTRREVVCGLLRDASDGVLQVRPNAVVMRGEN